MVYIGQSGENDNESSSLKEGITNSKKFRGTTAGTHWPRKMKAQHIEALYVYWYVTIHKKTTTYLKMFYELFSRYTSIFMAPCHDGINK